MGETHIRCIDDSIAGAYVADNMVETFFLQAWFASSDAKVLDECQLLREANASTWGCQS